MGPQRTDPLKDRGKTPNAGKKVEHADKISRTKKDEAEFLKGFEQKRKNLERVQGEYKGGINSKFKGEYDKAKREFESDEKKKAEFQESLKKLNDELDNMEDETWSPVKTEQSGQVDLPPADPNAIFDPFAAILKPQSGASLKPTVEVTNTDGGEGSSGGGGEDDGTEEGPLFTIDDLRKALGQEDAGTVVAWKQGGRSPKVVISSYGPRNARRYRLQKAAQASAVWQEDEMPKFTNTDVRFGEQKNNNKSYIHKGSEVLGILAVAWYWDDDNQKPEELMALKTQPNLEPLTKEQQKNRVRRAPRPPLYPETQVKVQWNINNEKKESWEVRDTIARLYGSHQTADQFIYLAAEYQETRYRQWKNKERKSEDRSPTPMPGLLRPSPTPKPEDKKPEVASSSGTSGEDKESAAMKKWAIKKKLDPENLSDADEARWDVYWETRQATPVAAPVAAQ